MTTPRRLLAALVLALLAGCGAGEPAAAPTTPAPTATAQPAPAVTEETTPEETAPEETAPAEDEAVVTLVGPDGTRLPFEVEVAADPPTRQRGLMERTELPEDAGMLFLFPEETQSGFWMKNTLIPLEIAYIAEDGAIVDVLEMEPCEADPCPVYTPDGPYRAALEVNAGALEAAGVDDTWRAELPEDLPEAQ